MHFLYQLPCLALVGASCVGASPDGRLLKLRRRAINPYVNTTTSNISPTSTSSSSSSQWVYVDGYGPPKTSSVSNSSSSSSSSDINNSPSPTPTSPPSSAPQSCYKTCYSEGCHSVCDDGTLTSDSGQTHGPLLNTTNLPVIPSLSNSSSLSYSSSLSNSSSFLGNLSIPSSWDQFTYTPCTSSSIYNTTQVIIWATESCAGVTTVYDEVIISEDPATVTETVTEVEIEIEYITVAASNSNWTPTPTPTLPPCTDISIYPITDSYPESCGDPRGAPMLNAGQSKPSIMGQRPDEFETESLPAPAALNTPDDFVRATTTRTTTLTSKKISVVVMPTEPPIPFFPVDPVDPVIPVIPVTQVSGNENRFPANGPPGFNPESDARSNTEESDNESFSPTSDIGDINPTNLSPPPNPNGPSPDSHNSGNPNSGNPNPGPIPGDSPYGEPNRGNPASRNPSPQEVQEQTSSRGNGQGNSGVNGQLPPEVNNQAPSEASGQAPGTGNSQPQLTGQRNSGENAEPPSGQASPGGNGKVQSVQNSETPGSGNQNSGGSSNQISEIGGSPDSTTVRVNNVDIVLGSNGVVVNGQTVTPGSASRDIVANGQTFNVDSSQIAGPGITLALASPPYVAGPGGNPTPTAVTAEGVVFSVGPSQAIIEGTTYAIGSGAAPTTAVVNGQTINIGPQGVGFDSTTVAVPPAAAAPTLSSVTAAGLTFAVNPSEAVVDGSTYQIGGGAAPATAVINGQTISLGPGGVGLDSTTVAVPPAGGAAATPILSSVTAAGLTFAVNPSEAFIGGSTYRIGVGASPTTAVINGQTVSLGPGGVGFDSTTVAAPPGGAGARPTLTAVAAGDLTFSLNPTEAVISGTTYSIGAAATTPTTAIINGQTVTLGPGGIAFGSTTIAVPRPTLSAVTAGGLTFSINPTQAVISGTTYFIGSGAAPTTTVINGQTISLGPGGIGLATTTVPVPRASGGAQERSSVITVGDLTITVEPTEAIISGVTYTIGDGATPTTAVINGQTISLGPGGVGLPSTTIPPLPRATGSGSFTGGARKAFATKESIIGLILAVGVGGVIML